ncbi:hypothetical protein [Mesorhizobium sp.]|uniref:hypothetical protein n=1 Tax=Mesorhizobium sp. TaxID=1871066 RepID=UPI000FE4242C|nr:hypothetical protein [Mesorhizobium sp.]RWH67069.1 MAG: hypothetical protein EOQ84_30150 [Mesorhizobium sp.]RWL22176.1 MAG: hypothetical protein EOR58_28330 [Mesorhizobium sp.]RWL24978.1 MAG: hypothetical protein EOR63_28620 [Mesorhizobium sp.]RWL30742.1 MAG: hypothetical protein EOR59_28730 [Mesorhizobium sp.]RWL49682.1 MAG: hypothetical protein EOR61_23925 [Mesorhizobium sp.]
MADVVGRFDQRHQLGGFRTQTVRGLMRKYYEVSTDGIYTNLQLYTLVQAQRYWNALVADHLEQKDATEDLVERCVFIVAILGLSVSQLLGQNDPTPKERKIASPKDIWRRFASHHNVMEVSTIEFDQFIDVYDACRHFGVSPDGFAHARLEPLDIEATRRWYEVAHRVWMAVMKALRSDLQNVIEQLDLDSLKGLSSWYALRG